jgi:hypothetical protein
VPAAASGKEYATLDARCEACEVLGGEENPCLPRGVLRQIARNTGRPCPRVELAPANVELANVLPFFINEELRPAARDQWRATFRGLGEEDQRLLRLRMAYALQHPAVGRSRRDAIKKQMKPEP